MKNVRKCNKNSIQFEVDNEKNIASHVSANIVPMLKEEEKIVKENVRK